MYEIAMSQIFMQYFVSYSFIITDTFHLNPANYIRNILNIVASTIETKINFNVFHTVQKKSLAMIEKCRCTDEKCERDMVNLHFFHFCEQNTHSNIYIGCECMWSTVHLMFTDDRKIENIWNIDVDGMSQYERMFCLCRRRLSSAASSSSSVKFDAVFEPFTFFQPNSSTHI